jgi:PAS domain S-box-containing protein
LNRELGTFIALSIIGVCSWHGGPIVASTLPLIVIVLSRIYAKEPQPLWPTMQEFTMLCVLCTLTASIGLAGQYRRRLKAVTQRHQARQREQSRALAAASIIFCDLNDRITEWTAGAEQLYGWTAAEAEGRTVHELLGTQFPEPLGRMHYELLHHGQWQGELRQRNKAGGELIVHTHWIVSHNDRGDPAGIAQIHNDVTPLRAAEAAAREADRRKDIFLATLAHELRNPLAPLRSGLDILSLEHDRSADEQEVLEVMSRQLQQLVRLIEDLLDVSRINTGKLHLRREQVQLAEVLQAAWQDSASERDGAELQCSLALPLEPLPLQADRARLTQVVMNLLSNAIKFTPADGRIDVSAEREGSSAVIRVRDTGIGISSEILPRLFEMFSQGTELTVRQHGGLGIGLSIVRSLVEMHGGTVEGQSAGPGLGSEFTIRLPLATVPSDERRPQPGAGESAGSAAVRRVLVVDDNKDAAGMLAQLLISSGCQAQVAYDGPSALCKADEFHPHAFVLDLGMPGMSGLTLAERLRTYPKFTNSLLIAVTGWGKDEDRRRTNDAGFDHHLVKPVDIEELRKLILQQG